MRRVLFWSHLLAGVAAGVVILIMSITGALLGFERQIVDLDGSACTAGCEHIRPSSACLLKS